MSNEKTIEELTAELESLRKANLERELAKEKKKIEEAATLEREKDEEELRNKIREELIEEMKGSSMVEKEKPETLGEKPKYEIFMDLMKKKYNLTGIRYDDLTRKISSPGNFKGERK